MVPERVRGAVALQNAMNDAPKYLKRLGHCPVERLERRAKYTGEELEDVDMSPVGSVSAGSEDSESHEESIEVDGFTVSKHLKSAVKVGNHGVNSESLSKMIEVTKEMSHIAKLFKSVEFNKRYDRELDRAKLKLNHSGVEWNGKLYKITDKVIEDWFQKANVAGFGDVKAQVTRIDTAVRDAREIPASGFECEPALLEEIRKLWSANFIPSKVRVEPYKITIYPPKGHFKLHRDTPEKDLVGTFLLGLYEENMPRLQVEQGRIGLSSGCWAAFYPEAPHEVIPGKKYRANIAFKIYAQESHWNPDDRYPAMKTMISDVLSKIPAPYGIKFKHLYSISMTHPKGFDSALLEAVKALPHCKSHVIPVLTHVDIYDYTELEGGYSYICNVFPLTDAHVDFLLGDADAIDKDHSIDWMKDLKVAIPFYRIEEATLKVSHKEEAVEHTGNESRGHTENSIYVSYAVVVLPNDADEKKSGGNQADGSQANNDEESDDWIILGGNPWERETYSKSREMKQVPSKAIHLVPSRHQSTVAD